MATYINSIASVSPQDFSGEFCLPTADNFQVVEPNYLTFLTSGEQRRMSRLVKMGVFSASQCIQGSDLQQVDGITVGTGWGGFDCSKKFKTTIFEKQESMLSPTTFIQALHNTTAGQIALNLKCYEYNATYSHRGFSFESALIDALLLLEENPDSRNILVGGLDELPEIHTEILRRSGYVKTEYEKVQDAKNQGIIPGEGATFTMISSEKNEKTLAEILTVRLLYNPETSEEVKNEILELLNNHQISPTQIDVLVLGTSGNILWDEKINTIEKELFPSNDKIFFKNLCGEYPTSTGFALQTTVNMLNDTLPYSMYDFPKKDDIKYSLIINHFKDVNYSFILIAKP